jgi:hypothetical protein
MKFTFNVTCPEGVGRYCNACVKIRPVWQFEGEDYCAWCRWRVTGDMSEPRMLPKRAFDLTSPTGSGAAPPSSTAAI